MLSGCCWSNILYRASTMMLNTHHTGGPSFVSSGSAVEITPLPLTGTGPVTVVP